MDNEIYEARVGNESFVENFWLNAKREIIDNRKFLLLGLACILGLYITTGAIMGYNGVGSGSSGVGIFTFYMMMFAFVGASVAFSDMKTKEERLYSLMVPASAFSKYLVKWLLSVPVLFGVLVLAFYIGDITRILTFLMTADNPHNYPDYLHITNPWKIYSMFDITRPALILTVLLSAYFLAQAPYFFGAILWPKNSFIKTFAAMWVIQTVCSIMFALSVKYFPSLMYHIGDSLWFMATVFILLTLAFYVAGFYLYRRQQVVYKLI